MVYPTYQWAAAVLFLSAVCGFMVYTSLFEMYIHNDYVLHYTHVQLAPGPWGKWGV